MSQESIIDTTKPNAGRMYDYFLGGHHNFEVDRQAAEQVLQLLPFTRKFARLQRWCLQDIATELTQKRGFETIVDFASGLPTNDHIHVVVPKGTTVIYSDYDPVVVEYAHDILKDVPNVYFFQSDARRPEELLNRPQVQDILQGRRDVAFVHWGITSFLSDEDISHTAHILHEWAGTRSCWALNAQAADVDLNDPLTIQVKQVYERTGTPMYARPLARFRELVQPWRPEERDFVSLLEWHGFDQTEMSKEDRSAFGPGGAGYGAYLVK
jgi:hypothetical protein